MNMFDSVVNVLGTEYTIKVKAYSDVPDFEKRSIDAYCDSILHEIVICDMHTFPGWENETDEYIAIQTKHQLRHEVIHAFLNESGLQDSATTYCSAWSKNEEMIDWWAIQGPKVYKAWEQVKAI